MELCNIDLICIISGKVVSADIDPCNRPLLCTTGETVANPANCTTYFECIYGDTWIERPCSLGLYFDPDSKFCVITKNCLSPCTPFTGVTKQDFTEGTTVDAETKIPERTFPDTSNVDITNPQTSTSDVSGIVTTSSDFDISTDQITTTYTVTDKTELTVTTQEPTTVSAVKTTVELPSESFFC